MLGIPTHALMTHFDAYKEQTNLKLHARMRGATDFFFQLALIATHIYDYELNCIHNFMCISRLLI